MPDSVNIQNAGSTYLFVSVSHTPAPMPIPLALTPFPLTGLFSHQIVVFLLTFSYFLGLTFTCFPTRGSLQSSTASLNNI